MGVVRGRGGGKAIGAYCYTTVIQNSALSGAMQGRQLAGNDIDGPYNDLIL
jgi:hypothetical protein